MVIVILMFTSLLLQASCAPVTEIKDNVNAPKPRYNFNHPPTVEEYNPVVEIVEYNENSAYTTRAIKGSNYSIASEEESTTTDNISVDTVQEQLREEVQTLKGKPKGRALDITRTTPTQVIQQGSKKINNGDEIQVGGKNTVRRTKVQKRILQQSSNNEKKIALNINLATPKNIKLTTVKPTLTTQTQNNINTKASTEVNKNNLKVVRERDPVVPIIESESYVYSHNGNFHYSYLGGDGTKASEQGRLKVFDDKSTGESVEGSFSYTDKDGNDFSLSYTADENGYRPVGAHLPTPPPIPPAIARALQYLSTKTAPESTTKI